MTQQIELIKFSLNYIAELRSWFSNKAELDIWAGPNFSYPHNEQTFIEDTKCQEIASYCLVDQSKNLLAFGQYYQRLAHCHLGRLVVNPHYRGQGLAKTLIEELSVKGMDELKLSSLSLFVIANNLPALTAYKKLGFIEQAYPEVLPIENCLYMVLSEAKVN